jgi:DNA-binding MarR family transcriptional regulator
MPRRSPLPVTENETELVDRLRAVLIRGSRSLRLTYTDENLSPTQLEVLAMVVRQGPMRLSEVAENDGLNPTMVSRIVAKLEESRLVRRTPDPLDGRVMHVTATDEGRALHGVIRRRRSEALQIALEDLSFEERASLTQAVTVLESVVESLKERRR